MLGYEVTPWCGILTLARTPITIVTKWNPEVARIRQLPDMKERLVAQRINLAWNTSKAFGALLKAKAPKWCKIVKDAGAKVNSPLAYVQNRPEAGI